MLLSLDSGVSALEQFQQSLNVIANNIANVNTVGFKSATVDFADTLSQTLGSDAAGTMQVGTGIMTASINNQFTPGSISSTGVQSDMAINGNGFFEVKDPTTGNTFVTRDGEFTKDPNGYLVTSSGMRLQGYSDAGLTTVGDVKIDGTGNSAGSTAAVQSYLINNNGTITVTLSDGTPSFTRGQVLLQNFSNPEQLVKVGGNLYSNLATAGPLAAPVAPGSNGLGGLNSGSLEMSNVDLAQELTSLITTQRAYEANSKVITTSDDVLQTLVNLKR
ncbi:MAG TPA: flagellar hook-basal body complex protein [Candidatus Acidoferrales bacterium]|jgi:flagellar hook protein FlgE|nr:flagellar hook-basal body complex protein [Candidatus Acidoferrales bacterium]